MKENSTARTSHQHIVINSRKAVKNKMTYYLGHSRLLLLLHHQFLPGPSFQKALILMRAAGVAAFEQEGHARDNLASISSRFRLVSTEVQGIVRSYSG